jgi:divalent metal cation (Fe/Co/Zn/Cd) transporter
MVPVTMHLGPKEILLNMDLRFRKGLRTGEIAAAIDRIENNIRKAHPQIKHIYLEVEALREA